MKKRIFAVLLILALVVTVGALAVSATTSVETKAAVSTAVEDAICPCGCGRKVTEIPEEEWQDWVFNTNLTNGHYRLAADQTGVARTLVGSSSAPAKVLLNLNGHSITTADGYRGITIYTGGTATLIGEGTISGYAASAGVIEIGGGSTFNLYQATISNINTNTAKYANGTAVSMSTGTSDVKTAFNMYSGTLNGGTLVGTSSSNKTAVASVYVGTHCRFNMYGGVLNAGVANSKNGNGVYMGASTSEFNLVGGELVGASGKTANRGGLVFISNGTMTMTGGKLSGAKAGRGAGVFMNGGTFNMEGGEISGCTATSTGYAVDVFGTGATFNMTGGTVASAVTAGIGTIHSKSANVNISGGVVNGNICSTQSITVSGAPKIANVDLVTADKDALAVATSITVGANGLTEKASIGVTAATGAVIVTDEKAADYVMNFYPADYRGKAQAQDNTIVLVADNSCPHCGGADATWSVWDGGAVATSGHYYLNADVTKTGGQIKIGDETNGVQDDIVLDLYGHTTNHTGSRYSIRGGDKIFLMDSGIGGELIGSTSASGGAINLNTDAEFTLHSGKVTDGYTGTRGSGTYGGAIDFAAKATAIIKGGTVTGNHAIYGAAIGVRNGGTLRIEGGTIVGGTATSGGAIAVMGSGTLEMIKGTVTGGYATGNGGNIYIGSDSEATISGGTVTGGIMEGASNGGGNISVVSGTLTVTGTAVIENGENIAGEEDNNRGGGNIFNNNGTVIISGGTIKNGTTNACGGNILSRGDLTISGGKIEGGTAETLGNSVALRSYDSSALDAVVAVSGGNVNDIVFIRNGVQSFTVSGAPVIGNLDFTNLNEGVTQLITLGENGVTGGSITVNVAENTPFSVANAELAEASCEYFHDANGVLTVKADANGQLILTEVKVPVECPHCGQMFTEEDWTPWTGGALTTAEANGVHYILTNDVLTGNGQIAIGVADDDETLDVDETLAVNVVINLDGHSLGRTVSEKGARVFAVYGGSTLNLVNTSSTESTVTGTKMNDYGGTINLSEGSNLNLYDNVKLVHAGQSEFKKIGGVVRVVDGTFTMHGGSIVADSASHGGAVAVDGTGSFIMDNGTITGGSATRGGAVYVDNGSFVMNNGTINGGTATWGGAVCLIDSTADEHATTFTMNNGIINGGTATRGAAIYAQTNNPVITIVNGTVNGGVINANDGGGTIGLGSGTATLNMNGGVVNGSQLTAETPRGGTAICNFASSATLNMNGGTINGYEGGTTAKGGAIYSDGKVFYTDGTINGCTSAAGDVMYFGTVSAELVMTLAENAEAMDAFSGKIVTLDSDDVTADAGYMVNDTDDIGTWYKDIDAAKANYVDGGYITVLTNENITLNGQTVDVNGHSITVNGTASCFDSSNDDYDGNAVVTMDTQPVSYINAPNGNLYITVKEAEGQYTFHRLVMGFERLSIRPRNAGVYYSSSWKADNALVGNWTGDDYETGPIITGFGMALKKGSAADGDSFTNGDKFAYTYFDNINGETNDFLANKKGAEINSCLLSNIINETNGAVVNQENAEVMIYATPYVEITNSNGETEYVMGPTYGNTLKGIVEWVVSEIDAMEEADRTKNIGFIEPLNTFAEECQLVDYFEGLATLING